MLPPEVRLPPAVAVHRGDWKLIRWFGLPLSDPGRYELYNLRSDLGGEGVERGQHLAHDAGHLLEMQLRRRRHQAPAHQVAQGIPLGRVEAPGVEPQAEEGGELED